MDIGRKIANEEYLAIIDTRTNTDKIICSVVGGVLFVILIFLVLYLGGNI